VVAAGGVQGVRCGLRSKHTALTSIAARRFLRVLCLHILAALPTACLRPDGRAAPCPGRVLVQLGGQASGWASSVYRFDLQS